MGTRSKSPAAKKKRIPKGSTPEARVKRLGHERAEAYRHLESIRAEVISASRSSPASIALSR